MWIEVLAAVKTRNDLLEEKWLMLLTKTTSMKRMVALWWHASYFSSNIWQTGEKQFLFIQVAAVKINQLVHTCRIHSMWKKMWCGTKKRKKCLLKYKKEKNYLFIFRRMLEKTSFFGEHLEECWEIISLVKNNTTLKLYKFDYTEVKLRRF